MKPVSSSTIDARRSRARYTVLGAIGLGSLMALLYWAPAAWLSHALYGLSHQYVLLAQTEGRVWAGSAQAIVRGGPDSRDASALPGRVHWRIRPRWSGLLVTIQADCCTTQDIDLRLPWNWRDGAIEVPQLRSTWPADGLSGLGAPWNTLQLHGPIEIDSPQGLRVLRQDGQWRIQGDVQLRLTQLSSPLAPLQALGTYVLHGQASALTSDAAAQAPVMQWTLRTQEGPLQLQGSGQWLYGSTHSQLRFAGEASTDEEHAAELNHLLNIIGRRQGRRSLLSLE